jgi:membrane protease YdiL (CAAX protease family)
LGLRSTHPAFYILGALLGLVIHLPVDVLFELIERKWPGPPPVLTKLFLESGPVQQITIAAILVALGPFVEEVFFRGALLRPLRKQSALASILAVTSITFAIAHFAPQTYLPIALVGVALGVLRIESGSLIPPAVMHAVFNGISLYAMATTKPGEEELKTSELPPLWLIIAGSVATVAILICARYLGAKSGEAARARAMDSR